MSRKSASDDTRGPAGGPPAPPPWIRPWLPIVVLAVFFFFEEGGDTAGAALARAGRSVTVSGKPAEAFGRLLDMGPDHRAAVTTRRMLASVLPREVARDVAAERFQHWTGRTPASHQLGTVGAPAVPLLTGLLDHENERVREQAAFALGDVGLAAAAALPALERLAKRTPQDASTRAASGALGDVAPTGLAGWLRKAWDEAPLAPALGLVLAPLVVLVLYPRRMAGQTADEMRRAAPPAWFVLAAGAQAAALLAFAGTDLLGERFTVEADVWSLSAGVWCACAAGYSVWLRRRADRGPAPG